MTKDEELAMDLALEALERMKGYGNVFLHRRDERNPHEQVCEAITAIKQARSAPVQSCYCPNCEAMGKELAALKAQPAPVQEPVACVQDLDEVKRKHLVYEKGMDWKDPLYTTAAQRQWVGLTDEEMQALLDRYAHMEMMRAIEAKLKEKNT